jgi:hypothetical protein
VGIGSSGRGVRPSVSSSAGVDLGELFIRSHSGDYLIKSVRPLFVSEWRVLMAGFRNTLLIIAGMNAVLMVPSCFFMKARLPPRTPPPWKSLKRPWQDPRYVCLVIGSCLNMMMYVLSSNIQYHADIQSPITLLQCPPLYNLQQHLTYNHLLLCRFRPSWLIHRQGRFWIHGGCVRRMERIHRFRSIPYCYPTRFLDGCTITRRSSRHWDFHVRDRERSLVSARSS